MNRQWKKTISVLLLFALLCTVPCLAAAEESGDAGSADTTASGDSGTTTVLTAGGDTGGGTGGDTGSTDTSGSGETGSCGTTGTTGSDTATEQENVVVVEPDGTAVTPAAGPTVLLPDEPAAAVTPSPTPTATPTPSPTPTPKAALPVVTKHPTDETVDEGGECMFIADYSNAIWAVWHFVSKDGKTDYRFDDKQLATAFPGLTVENGMYSAMTLRNIPYELNGWRVCCEYRNNTGSVRTNYATVTVRPDPNATPTPSPTPSPTAAPTPTPTPTPTVTTTPEPTQTVPTPEPTPDTTQGTAVKRSSSHFFLKLTVGTVLLGAAICGTILFLNKRATEAETTQTTDDTDDE